MLPHFPAGKGNREIRSKRKGNGGKEEFLKGKYNQASRALSSSRTGKGLRKQQEHPLGKLK